MSSGIYAIFNSKSGKAYIGQTRNLERRKADHFRSLKKGKHHNHYLQRAFNADGEAAFHFIVMEECSVDKLDELERYYITRLQTMDNFLGYNLENGGNVGKEISERSREAKRGEKNPMFGKHLPPERIESLRIRNRCHGSKLREEDVAGIKEDLAQHMPLREVTEKYGTTRAIVTKIKTGANFAWVRPDLNEAISEKYQKEVRNKKILELEAAGKSRREISVMLGITPATVTRVLGKPSEVFYKNSPRKMKLKQDVIDDYENGVPRDEIMRKYGLNPSTYVSLISETYNKKLEATKQKAIEMRKSGMMVKDIAKELGYARTTISRWTKAIMETP